MKNGYTAAAWVTALGTALTIWIWEPYPMSPPVTGGIWETFRDCESCPEMVVVPAGSFMFGAGAHKHWVDRPVFPVTFAKPYAMGRYEVTIAEWAACVRAGGCPIAESEFRSDALMGFTPDHPRTSAEWDEARQYAAWLSEITGKRYRLPSMTEWEWAARAGTKTRWHWGERASNERSNLGVGKSARAKPVGQYPPNPFGLYDVAGNLSEWVLDCLTKDASLIPRDGRPYQSEDPEECGDRQVAGMYTWTHPNADGLLTWHGSWINPKLDVTASGAASFIGFRVLRELD